MVDLLPDIPADVFNQWSADQFAQAAQAKIATLPGDIASAVQNANTPPFAPAPPAPAPEPPPVASPPESPPEPAPPPVAPPVPSPPPAPAPVSSPPPFQGPAPDASSPQHNPPQLPTPTAPEAAAPAPSSQDFDPFAAALSAASDAGANVQQFSQHFNNFLGSSGGDLMLAGMNAAATAGGDVQKFADTYGAAFPQIPQQQQPAPQPDQQAPQSLGIQGPQPNQPGDLIDQARQAAVAAGINPDIFTRQIQQESNFNPSAKSGAGAEGIAQFMPGTAQGLGIDPMNPQQALTAAAQMDAQNLKKYGGDWGETLAAYNAGPGNVDKYGGIPPFQETQTYVQNILGGAKNVVQQAADSGVQAVNNLGQAAQSAVARTSQFAMGLSSGDAMAFCGPAAAMAFAQTFGRNPTVDEAKQLAAQVGWNPDQGMAGPSSEVSLLNKLGIDTHMTTGVNWQQVASDASSGNPVIIDTPGHYFYVDGYNADTGQFHFGTSATDLKAAHGQEWFTPDQISSLGMGDPRAAIYADHPLSGPGVASSAPQIVNQASDFLGGLGQQAQDTMSAVLSTGLSTAQDAVSGLGSRVQSAAPDLTQTQLYQNLTGTNPNQADLNANWDAAQQAAQQATGSTVSIPSNPLDLLGGMSPFGIGQAGEQETAARNAAIAANNPIADVPVLGGLSTLAGQTALDPTLLMLGAGPELGTAVSDALSDPIVQAALQSRLPAQAEINAALGGLPGLAASGANAGRDVYTAAMQRLTQPATGAAQVQRALDALSAYPDEISSPLSQTVSDLAAAGHDQSQIASTVFQWMRDNPLSGPSAVVPDIATATGADLRDAGQQAVTDIAGAVQQATRQGLGPYLPSGEMPGQLGLDIGALTRAQPSLPEGTGGAGLPDTGLSGGEQSWLQQVQNALAQRDFSGLQNALQQAGLLASDTGTRVSDQLGMIPGFEQGSLPGEQIPLTEGAGGAGVPSPSTGASTLQWLQDLRQAAAQRDFGGVQQALQDAGLLGDRTSTSSVAAGDYTRGGPAEATQGVLPGFNPLNPVSWQDWLKLARTAGVTSAASTFTKVGARMLTQPLFSTVAHTAQDIGTLQPGRALGGLVGILDSFGQAGNEALGGFADSFRDPNAVSVRVGQDSPFAQWAARLLEGVPDMHAAAQSFNEAFGTLQEMRRAAGQMAQNEGLTPLTQAWKDRYNEILANPPQALTDAASSVGQRMALRGDLGDAGQLINRIVKANGDQQGFGQSVQGNMIWPVFRVGWNGLMQDIEQSALGGVGTAMDVARGLTGTGGPYQGAKLSELLPALRNEITAGGSPIPSPFNQPVKPGVTPLGERVMNNTIGTAASVAGTAIATALAGHGMAGAISGMGPFDKATRDQLLAGGWLPNAAKIGNTWTDVTNMPGSLTMQLLGDLMDSVNYPTASEQRAVGSGRTSLAVPDWVYQLEGKGGQGINADAGQSAWRLVQHVGQNLGDRAGLGVIANVANAIYGRTAPTAAVGNEIASMVGSNIPFSGTLRSIAQATDPYQRQAANVLQGIEQNIPGLREQVPTRLAPTGESMPNPQAGAGALSPHRTGAAVDDPTLALLDARGVAIPAVSSTISSRTGAGQVEGITADEQHLLEGRRGYLIQQNVKAAQADPAYARADQNTQAEMLSRAISTANTQAEGELFGKIAADEAAQGIKPAGPGSRISPAKKLPITVPAGRPRAPVTAP